MGHNAVYIVWKGRARRPDAWGHPRGRPSMIAYAATAWREGGRIRRTCRYLAALRHSTLEPVRERARFWRRVDAALDRLDLAPGVRAGLEARIGERVPRATLDDLKAEVAELTRLRADFYRKLEADRAPK